MTTLIQVGSGEWWIADELLDQIVASDGVTDPGKLYGVPIVMDETKDELQKAGEAIEAAFSYPDQCSYTAATLKLRGLTARGAVHPIISRRSRRCPCGQLHSNGKYRAFKNCCMRPELVAK